MRPINYRRYRRRHPSTPDISTKKTDAAPFFGELHASTFFPPANAPQANVLHRQATTEKEEPAVQAKNDDEKEEPAVMRAAAQEPEDEEKKAQRAVGKDEEEKVARKESGVATPPAQHVSNYIGSLNGKGTTLPNAPAYFFAARMGYDFSKVRVHTDSEAAQSAKDINAKAYTVGNHIVFNEGQYNPESNDGKKLLAHELTHVVQQGKGIATKIQCSPDDKKPYKPSDSDLNKIAAVAGSEAQPGQESDLADVYYNRVKNSHGLTGLDVSHAYNSKSNNYKMFLLLLGDTTHASDKPKKKKGDELSTYETFADAVKENSWFNNKEKPRLRRIKERLKALFDGTEQPNLNLVNNANLDDVNGNYEWSPSLRQYLFLSDQGEVDGIYATQIGSGKTWQVLYDMGKIEAFFRKNRTLLPPNVKLYKPSK